jgi:hypothetical protein
MLPFISFLVFAIVVAFFMITIYQSIQLSKKYGPQRQIGGSPVLQGRLVCESWKAPTLGQKLEFPYEVKLYASGNNLTGEYYYTAARKIKALYTGKIFLSANRGQVVGRFQGGSSNEAIEGKLSPREANLTVGFPKSSRLGFISRPFRFRIVNGQVVFANQSLDIGKNSKLYVSENQITGRLVHYREAWIVNVDVSYSAELAQLELVVLALLLSGNFILSHHYD